MAPPPRPWFRFYVEAVASDRKVRRLDIRYRWLWVAVLAAARQSPTPGRLLVSPAVAFTDDDLADFAAMPLADVRKGMAALAAAELVCRGDLGEWVVPKWDQRQFESDAVSDRTARHRAKTRDGTFHRGSEEQPKDVPGNDVRTGPEFRGQRVVEEPPHQPLTVPRARATEGGGDPSGTSRADEALDLLVQAEERAELAKGVEIRRPAPWRTRVRHRLIDDGVGPALVALANDHHDWTAAQLVAGLNGQAKPREFYVATGAAPAPDAAERMRALRAETRR